MRIAADRKAPGLHKFACLSPRESFFTAVKRTRGEKGEKREKERTRSLRTYSNATAMSRVPVVLSIITIDVSPWTRKVPPRSDLVIAARLDRDIL